MASGSDSDAGADDEEEQGEGPAIDPKRALIMLGSTIDKFCTYVSDINKPKPAAVVSFASSHGFDWDKNDITPKSWQKYRRKLIKAMQAIAHAITACFSLDSTSLRRRRTLLRSCMQQIDSISRHIEITLESLYAERPTADIPWAVITPMIVFLSITTIAATLLSSRPCAGRNARRLLAPLQSFEAFQHCIRQLYAPDHSCSVIYALINIDTYATYIGRTCNSTTRPRTHMRHIWRLALGLKPRHRAPRKYAVASSLSPFRWVWIPLLDVDEMSAHSVEQRCIRRYRPSLNCVALPGARAHHRRLMSYLRKPTRDTSLVMAYSAFQPVHNSSTVTYTSASHNIPPARSLSHILAIAQKEGWLNVSVTRTDAPNDFTNWRTIRRHYPLLELTVTPATVDITLTAPLHELIPIIRTCSCTISFSRAVLENEVTRQRIVRILRQTAYGRAPFHTRALILMHPNDLLWLYCSAHRLVLPDRKLLQSKVHGILRKFHKMPPLKHLVFSTPFLHYNRRHIRTHLTHLIKQTILPEWMKTYILRRMRIVFTKRESIADIMCNLIATSKSLLPAAPSCACSQIRRVLRTTSTPNSLAPPLEGHISIRACDLPDHLAPLKQCLKNVPVPNAPDAASEIRTAFTRFYRTLCELHLTDPRKGESPRAGISTPTAHKVMYSYARHCHHLIYWERTIRTITHKRYSMLKRMYFSTKSRDPALFSNMSVRSFHVELVLLAFRYSSSHSFQPQHLNSTISDRIFEAVSHCFPVDCVLFSSPFDTPPDTHYCTRYKRDQLFGAKHDAFTHQWSGTSFAEPVFTPRFLNRTYGFAIHSATVATLPTCTIVVTPILPEPNHTKSALGHAFSHLIALFCPSPRRHSSKLAMFAVCNDLFLTSHRISETAWCTLTSILKDTYHGCTTPRLPPSSRRGHHTFFYTPYKWKHTIPSSFQKQTPWSSFTSTNTANTQSPNVVCLSNALNSCFARPSDATVTCEFLHIRTARENNVVPSTSFFTDLRHSLGDAVVGFQDKNAGQCTIECPVIQWHRDRRMFFDNPTNFEHVALSTTEYRQLMKQHHTEHDWDRIAPFPSKSNTHIPYAYAFQKFKDANKDRPIMSYFKHCCKKIYRLGSRGLSYILKHSKLESFTLWNVQDLSEATFKIYDEIGDTFGPSTRNRPYCADVKEMYTRLPHAELKNSIEFAITHCAENTKRGRRRCLTFERLKNGTINFGRSDPHLKSQLVTLTFDEIRTICFIDIETAYFTALGTLLLQILGVPMGSPGSTAYAICLCMYSEHKFHSSMRDYLRLVGLQHVDRIFRFIRYVDDVFGIIVWDCNDPTTWYHAVHIIHFLENHTYPTGMILKREPSVGWFPFLEALIRVPARGRPEVQFNNKNFEHILASGTPKTYTFQHRASFMSPSDAVSKILGALHRLRRTVPGSDPRTRITNSLQMFAVFQQQGYTHSEMKRALFHLHRKTKEVIWQRIIPIIDTLPKHPT